MQLETLGHASLLLRDDTGAPVLLTDPWLLGSCYWRSWWLQNPPSESQIDELRSVPWIYVTHEHPDHFHTASIKALGIGPSYLAPTLPNENISGYLRGLGHDARALPARGWTALTPEISILSLPLATDDSVLLVLTPDAAIVNINDSKPPARNLRKLGEFLDSLDEQTGGSKRKRILMSSYSPASIVNSFFAAGERVSVRDRESYVAAVSSMCRTLNATHFAPFASQVVFRRIDSDWANDFKVTHHDLKAHWAAPQTELLPCYVQLDLGTGAYVAPDPSTYTKPAADVAAKIADQLDREASQTFDSAAQKLLEDKLNRFRVRLALIFRRGIGFRVGKHQRFTWSPLTGQLVEGDDSGNFVLSVPAGPLTDVLTYDHFGDLGITMFTEIELRGKTSPKVVYGFFWLLTLDDYGHTGTATDLRRWATSAARAQSWKLPTPT